MYFTKLHSHFLNILQAETRIQQTADGLHFWILYCLTSSVNLKKNHNWKPQEIRETAILICYGSQIQERILVLAEYNSQDQKVPLFFLPPSRIKYKFANMLKQF